MKPSRQKRKLIRREFETALAIVQRDWSSHVWELEFAATLPDDTRWLARNKVLQTRDGCRRLLRACRVALSNGMIPPGDGLPPGETVTDTITHSTNTRWARR